MSYVINYNGNTEDWGCLANVSGYLDEGDDAVLCMYDSESMDEYIGQWERDCEITLVSHHTTG